MRESRSGFTLVEVLTLVGILGVLAALVLVLMPEPVVHVHVQLPEKAEAAPTSITISPDQLTIAPKSLTIAPERLIMKEPEMIRDGPRASRRQFEAAKVDCMNNVRQLVGLLEAGGATRYPMYSGPNLLLYFVKKGELMGEDNLKLLFCPGDLMDTLEAAGGSEAYRDIDLDRREYDHLTSYAGRDQLDAKCRALKGAAAPFVLVCDDSEDHHDGKGIVVGLTGGAVKWRDKVDSYRMAADAPLEIGKDSAIEELTCLRSE